nr:hypothetical protein [Halomarina sp. PSR21]
MNSRLPHSLVLRGFVLSFDPLSIRIGLLLISGDEDPIAECGVRHGYRERVDVTHVYGVLGVLLEFSIDAVTEPESLARLFAPGSRSATSTSDDSSAVPRIREPKRCANSTAVCAR